MRVKPVLTSPSGASMRSRADQWQEDFVDDLDQGRVRQGRRGS